MTSVPACLSPDVRVPCRLCGDLLHRVADERLDEFTWVEEGGRTTGTDSDLRPLYANGSNPYARLTWLAERMDAARAVASRGAKVMLTPVYWAAAREYSALKVRLEMGGTFHVHRVRASDTPSYQGPAVNHCDYPAWLRPSGWQCRKCRRPLEVAVI